MSEPFKFPTAEEITRDWGERCADFDQDCGCCQMWNTYDLIAAKDAEIAKLKAELAATYEELIDHNGDDLNDSRAKRVAALNQGASDA